MNEACPRQLCPCCFQREVFERLERIETNVGLILTRPTGGMSAEDVKTLNTQLSDAIARIEKAGK